MSLFRRKQASSSRDERSLLDEDPPPDSSLDSQIDATMSANRSRFLASWSKNNDAAGRATSPSNSARNLNSNLISPLRPNTVSPRISTSSRTSVFERSVDNSMVSANAATGSSQDGNPMRLVSPGHAQLVVDNQIPSVLDASVETIVSNEDLAKVEIVTVQSTYATENLSAPILPNPWSEEEDPSSAELSAGFKALGAAKRLSFVSYADLLGVEHAVAEAEAASLNSTEPRLPNLASCAQHLPNGRDPLDTLQIANDLPGRRNKSIVTLNTPAAGDLELTSTSMAKTILQPSLVLDAANPWS